MTRQQLKAFRKKLSLSQRELADCLKVHITTVQRWEQGDVEIPYSIELALKSRSAQKKIKGSKPMNQAEKELKTVIKEICLELQKPGTPSWLRQVAGVVTEEKKKALERAISHALKGKAIEPDGQRVIANVLPAGKPKSTGQLLIRVALLRSRKMDQIGVKAFESVLKVAGWGG